MKLLDDYFILKEQLFEYFGYVEDWVVIPIDDARKYVWRLNGTEERGEIQFADTVNDLNDIEAGEYYINEIYTQRFLPKYVYRGKDYTMICVDTHTDGNRFLQIFSNENEIKNDQ